MAQNVPLTTYALHGLRLRSELSLAGFPADGGRPDVEVHWGPEAPVSDDAPPGPLVAERYAGDRRWYVAVDDGDRYVLRVPGVCDFVVAKGLDAVECRRDPAADLGIVELLASGLLVAFLLGLGGHGVLHASAVAWEDGAVGFAADTGMGKSTLAALLSAHGARFLTDDLLRVGFTPEPACIGGAPQVRLRRHADGGRAAMEALAGAPAALTADDRLAVGPSGTEHGDHRLAAIVLPRPARDVDRIELQPVRGAEAFTRLLAFSRVGGWRDGKVLVSQLAVFSRLAAEVPVFEAAVPWGPPFAVDDWVSALAGLGSRHRAP